MSTTPATPVTAPTPAALTGAGADAGTRRRGPSTRRLITSELRLVLRDPLTLTFVVAFPVVTMIVIAGSFGEVPDAVFPVNPQHWYVASYLTAVIGAAGLIMLPVHIAGYRERGVLRRFAASGFSRWSFSTAQVAVGLIAMLVACGLLLAVAAGVYGVPAVEDAWRTVAGVLASATAFIGIGVLLGTLLPSARAAQAIGLLLYFPSFLLGGGGPPPGAMSQTLADVAEYLPLSQATMAIREPWLGTGDGMPHLLVVVAITVVALALAGRRSSL